MFILCIRRISHLLPRNPQNHLRNVARKSCPTKFVYLVDIDIIPRFSLATDLNHFLDGEKCEKCIYVIPTYEIEEHADLPKNKQSLIELVKAKQAQVYRIKAYDANQGATNSSHVLCGC